MMKVLIFDFDGVIADSLDTVLAILNRIGHKYELQEFDRAFVEKAFMKNFFEFIKEIGFNPLKLLPFLNELKQELMQSIPDMPVFPGMADALKQLSKNPMFIVTSNLSDVVREHLHKHNIEYFAEILGADHSTSKVEKIKSVQEKVQGEFIFVTDTVADIIEAKKTDVKIIAVTWGFQKRETLAAYEPDIIVETPQELVKAVESL